MEQSLEANFSVLVMSIASSAAMSMGLAANPQTGNIEKDKNMAKFNVDLLVMLQSKTINNLNAEEKHFIDAVVSDLQLKFVHM